MRSLLSSPRQRWRLVLGGLLAYLTSTGMLTAATPPAVEWHKEYGGSGEESHPHYVIALRSGDLVMVGETGFVEDNSARILVVSTNPDGDLPWKRELGKPGHNLGNGLAETEDGQIIVAGALNRDAMLAKLDARTGATLWQKTWDLGSEDAFESVAALKDGLIATGYRDGLGEGTFMNWGKGILLRTDGKGVELWQQDIAPHMSSGYRVVPRQDGYLVMGHPRDEETLECSLLKTNQRGDVQWQRTYSTIYWGFDVAKNGRMLLTGHTRKSPLSKNWDIEATITDPQGKALTTTFFGQPRGYDGRWIHDEVWGARATPDDGWLIVAGTGDETRRYEKDGHPSGPSGQWKIFLIKTDAAGEREWQGVYGSHETDWAGEDVCLTRDGGALIANDCSQFGFTKIAPFLPTGKRD